MVKPSASLHPFLMHPVIRWLAVLVWLGVTCAFLLLPGEDSIVEDAHNFIGGTEVADWIGHVVLFAVLAGLLYGALCCHIAPPAALGATIWITIVLGAAIEAAQLLIDSRGASVLDAAGNWLGMALFVIWLWRRGQAPAHHRQNR